MKRNVDVESVKDKPDEPLKKRRDGGSIFANEEEVGREESTREDG